MSKLDPRRTDYNDVYMIEEAERIVPRFAWDADDTDEKVPLANPVSYIVVGYTRTPPCDNAYKCYVTVKTMQTDALENNLPDLPYNFIVGGNGFVYEGRGWEVQPSLPPRLNYLESRSLYIGLVGDRDSVSKDDDMVREVREASRELIRYGMDHARITRNILLYNISWDSSHLT